MSLIVYIEGNIGAGKSTLIARLRKLYDPEECLVMTEPVSNWPSLKLFYENKRKYALQLQTEVMFSFNERETKCANKELYVFERSLYSSLNVFAHLNCTKTEIDELQRLYEQMGRKTLVDNTTQILYIYIRTPAEICFQHIMKRQKPTDGYIDLEYLQRLERMHDDVFLGKTGIYVVDGNQCIDNIVNEVKQCIDLKNFILRNT